MAKCFKCEHTLPPRERIFRATTCESCGADVRVCRNCTFYEPGSHWDCRETIPEAVREKDRANFCEYFRIAADDSGPQGSPGPSGETGDKPAAARDRFQSLFGDH